MVKALMVFKFWLKFYCEIQFGFGNYVFYFVGNVIVVFQYGCLLLGIEKQIGIWYLGWFLNFNGKRLIYFIYIYYLDNIKYLLSCQFWVKCYEDGKELELKRLLFRWGDLIGSVGVMSKYYVL